MKQWAKTLFFGLAVIGSLWLGHRSAQAQVGATIDSTHYWTYHLVDPVLFPSPILLRDQFFLNYIPNQVDSITHLVNWVRKNNSQVRDTTLHFTWWNLTDKPVVNSPVKISNQFGTFDITVLNLEFLLAPAYKNYNAAVPPWQNLSHYTCYRAVGPGPNAPYSIIDEWRQDVQVVNQLEYLCAPCWKLHNGQTYAPIDTVTHLALYRIHPQSNLFVPFVADQFQQRQYSVRQQLPQEYLLVPSTKTHIPTDVRQSTWGKLKVLYR